MATKAARIQNNRGSPYLVLLSYITYFFNHFNVKKSKGFSGIFMQNKKA